MPNYAFTTGRPLPSVSNGHTFNMVNFTQVSPHTIIFSGITGLTFTKCNLTNCDVPVNATIIDSPNRHREFCANIHPRWTEKGLPIEVENCNHVVDTDVITIDGVVVDTVYHYLDTEVV